MVNLRNPSLLLVVMSVMRYRVMYEVPIKSTWDLKNIWMFRRGRVPRD